MKPAARWALRGGIALGVGALLVLAIRSWVVPRVIAAQLRSRFHGPAAFDGWWLGLRSAGVTGLTLNEGPGLDSPAWLRADRVETDLSLGSLLRGRSAPSKLGLRGPKLSLRFARNGDLLTTAPFAGGPSPPGPAPEVTIEGGEVAIHQEGRPPTVVRGVSGRMYREEDVEDLELDGDDPDWGHWTIRGRFSGDFKHGSARLASAPGFASTPDLMARVPFVPSEVWQNVSPTGPVDVAVILDVVEGAPKPVHVRSEVTFRDATTKLPTLGIVADGTRGRIVVQDGLVRLDGLTGRALAGTIAANGSLDFQGAFPRFDVELALGGIDVAKAPASWQLGEVGASGWLTGKARLIVAMKPDGPDLTGSSGEAVIDGATLQGIPIKSLRLAMRATGTDLRFDSETGQAPPDAKPPVGRWSAPVLRGLVAGRWQGAESREHSVEDPGRRSSGWPGQSLRAPEGTAPACHPGHEDLAPATRRRPPPEVFDTVSGEQRARSGEQRRIGPLLSAHRSRHSAIVLGLVALQEPKTPPAPRFHLPESITTQIELEDVDLATVLARLEVMSRIRPPVPMAGKLSLKARATIPLGHLTDLKDYTIRGEATLKGATIDAVDLGRLSARFALVKGVLDLDDLAGQLVERPSGTASAPPPASPPVPAEAPLPEGGFRGKLHAELSPPGKLTAQFQARNLPLSELAAPFFPVPTPVGGRLSATLDASGNVARLSDPASWSVRGRIESDRVRYRDATLDTLATQFTIEGGRVNLPDLAAKLGGNPLDAKLTLDMAGTRAFAGEVDVKGWAIERVLALVPSALKPVPASGIVDGRVSFRGTLRPLSLTSDGRVTIHDAIVESIPLGGVAATWATRGDEVVVQEFRARPFSGSLTGHATIPSTPDRPARVEATFADIRTDQFADVLTRGQFKLSGTAGGKLDATIPADPKALAVDLTLQAPVLTVQGIPAGTVSAAIRGKGEVIEYEVTADGPVGKVRFKGNVPMGGPSTAKPANAEAQIWGFGPGDLARLVGVGGFPPELKGRAAIDANLRARTPALGGVAVHGFVEVQDLRWGDHIPIGGLRGVVLRSADAWRIDTIRGDVAGGVAQGAAWGETPARGPRSASFELETDRAALSRLLAIAPSLAKRADGYGTLRIAGKMGEVLDTNAELTVTTARIGGVPIADLRLPAEFTYHPAEDRGTIQLRRWTARVAGGRAQGTGWLRVGVDKSFSTEVELADVDVESLMRIGTTEARPGSGKVNGRVTIGGTDPDRPRTYRGQIRLGLHDASIGDIPVIRALDRFLGAAQGGAFEKGWLRASIADGRILVDDLRLEGRVLQIHGTGVVSFNGSVDLAVLVNTNQIIPQTGEALASLIPGLRQAVGRDDETRLRVANYLSTRLLKFRVGGTVANPSVALDRSVAVGDDATGFFAGVLRLPLGFVK